MSYLENAVRIVIYAMRILMVLQVGNLQKYNKKLKWQYNGKTFFHQLLEHVLTTLGKKVLPAYCHT